MTTPKPKPSRPNGAASSSSRGSTRTSRTKILNDHTNKVAQRASAGTDSTKRAKTRSKEAIQGPEHPEDYDHRKRTNNTPSPLPENMRVDAENDQAAQRGPTTPIGRQGRGVKRPSRTSGKNSIKTDSNSAHHSRPVKYSRKLKALLAQRQILDRQIELEMAFLSKPAQEQAAIRIQTRVRGHQGRNIAELQMEVARQRHYKFLKSLIPKVARSYVKQIMDTATTAVAEIVKDMPLLEMQHYPKPKYKLRNAIDEGTFGQVHIGQHKATRQVVAIKLVEKRRLSEYVDLKRLVREVRSSKRVRHRNVIQMFEVVEAPKHIHIVMEFIDGGKLFDYIVQKSRLPEMEACFLFRQILDGVDHIHSVGVAHRDLKPENIMLQSSSVLPLTGWRIKIIDFDLSNVMEGGPASTGGLKKLKTACGSPHYAAPEVVAGEEYIGTCSDVWALGVILFAMICGYLPYEDPNIGILYEKIMRADYSTPNFISPQSVDLLRCIFETSPQFRYTIDQIRRHPWTADIRVPEPTPFDKVDSTDAQLAAVQLSMQAKALGALEELGMPKADVQQRLDDDVHDHVTTGYHLLVKRMQSMAEDQWLENQLEEDDDEDDDDEEEEEEDFNNVRRSSKSSESRVVGSSR